VRLCESQSIASDREKLIDHRDVCWLIIESASLKRAGPALMTLGRAIPSRLEQDSKYEDDTTRSYKCQMLALEQRGSERRRVMRVDRKAGGRCIVRVNKSSVSGQPHASASSSSPSSRKKTRWEAAQAPSVTCKSNDRIDGVDGSSALSSAALVPAPGYRRGGRTGAEAPLPPPPSPPDQALPNGFKQGNPRDSHKQTGGVLAPVWEIEGPGLPSGRLSPLFLQDSQVYRTCVRRKCSHMRISNCNGRVSEPRRICLYSE